MFKSVLIYGNRNRNLFKQLVQQCLINNNKCYSSGILCEEIRIPGPWGDIAGKWWGPRDRRPFLALHGWQDNCGTFDRLAPLLPPHIGLLAVDLPGHGYSARLPPGMFYHGIDISIFIRKIIDHFNWPKVSLFGHSLGALNSYAYTMMFPADVDILICLDGLFPIYREKTSHADTMANTINDFIKYDGFVALDKEPPSYPFAQLERLLHEGSRKSINIETCKYVLERNIKPSQNDPNRFIFTRDPRLKVGPLLQWSEDVVVEGSKRITCPLFLALGKQSFFFQVETVFLKILDVVKEDNGKVEYHVVEGTHHVHLNNPENISGLLEAFIEKYYECDNGVSDYGDKIKVVSKC